MTELQVELLTPSLKFLNDYQHHLTKGWSPDNIWTERTAKAQLEAIAQSPEVFIQSLNDVNGLNPAIKLSDGSRVRPLPSISRWIWQSGFCGAIQLRWSPDSDALPYFCPGHVGYSIVPERRREGLASSALRHLLPIAQAIGLRQLTIHVSVTNVASQKVIQSAGGELLSVANFDTEFNSQGCAIYCIHL
ncbi:MAG: hypothetical protein H6R13_8 [Proteobacteria bacterium]|nr:hypothetical protein [Pseudomonadota bacterium]